ncbi:MAG: phosphoribosylformylglycinamidine synthase subunit PurS [Candidatus Omnitrophica bacterium]|nr:phosphoribosylformylglycinamidine synthase subunit PurS [Candidatus Omnitrophota bacterium]
MFWRVEIQNKPGVFDASGEGIKKDIADLNIQGIASVRVADVFVIEGNVSESQIKRISSELLADPIAKRHAHPGGLL